MAAAQETLNGGANPAWLEEIGSELMPAAALAAEEGRARALAEAAKRLVERMRQSQQVASPKNTNESAVGGDGGEVVRKDGVAVSGEESQGFKESVSKGKKRESAEAGGELARTIVMINKVRGRYDMFRRQLI